MNTLWVVAFLSSSSASLASNNTNPGHLTNSQSSAFKRASEQSGTATAGSPFNRRSAAQGRLEAGSGETVPVLVATAVQKSVPDADPRRRQRRSLFDGWAIESQSDRGYL